MGDSPLARPIYTALKASNATGGVYHIPLAASSLSVVYNQQVGGGWDNVALGMGPGRHTQRS